MLEHPRSEEIAAAIAQCMPHAGVWSGTFFRATATSYANSVDLLSGKGSARSGGRWNPPGYRSVYGSLDPHTAMSESLANYEDHGIPLSQAMPLVFVGVDAHLQAVLDVMSTEFLDRLDLTIAGLSQFDWQAEQDAGREALTQAIGRAAYAAGLEGILVPSARVSAARNIVVFPQRRRKGSSLRVENARRLPKKKRS
ncbi:MAG TPA: RES family NAD+ phosphorylase [Pirellulales bacterium]|jgi:RES domain-containing protein|nr:RES family NAD+ phosphorylase [Pirellulales bacterium]